MRLQDNIDFTTLTWVKPELDETLKQARNALQNYVEEGEDPNELKTCSQLLHQVQGTLRMVELYGAAMVAEEMEQLAKALVAGKVTSNKDAAYASLMQGIVQLPDYLERLQSGHRDIPIVLLPLLNTLRESRGEKGLNEAVLFNPDLSSPLPDSARGPQMPMDPAELGRRAEGMRGLFQGSLLRWLKDDSSGSTTALEMAEVCDQLVALTWAEPARRLFWVASGLLDGIAKGKLAATPQLKAAIGKVEREIKRLSDGGDASFRSNPPLDLTKQLLFFVASEGGEEGRIGEIRNTFGLSSSAPSETELAHARGSLTGQNRALLETVAVAIKEDLLRVKDALDLHLRTPGASLAELTPQSEALDRVADTLGMLGLGVPRRVVQDQRTAINDVITGQRKGNEETLLDIAGALLYVEAALDDQVERLGREDAAAVPADSAAAVAALAPAGDRKLLEVLVKEAIVNFGEARQAFVAFVETHWDHAQLAEVPRLLTEVSGALRILSLPEPSEYLVAIRQFTGRELLHRRQVPNGQQMDRLADALAGIEYFLEALRDRRPNRDQILEVARQSLEALGYWPLSDEQRETPAAAAPVAAAPKAEAAKPASESPQAAASAPEVAAPTSTVPAAPTPAPEVVVEQFAPLAAAVPSAPELVPAAARAAAAVATGVLVPGFDGSSSEEIDDEIREVFLEEFEEEIDNLGELLTPWRADPANAELLRPIRRVFHTLKGSGRLVGAKTLGEFSWKVESLLNRVLDGSRPASPQVLAMVQVAHEQLPRLRAALQGETVHADLAGIEEIAERLSAGEEVTYVAVVAPTAPVAVEPQVDVEEVATPVVEAASIAEVSAPVAEAEPEPEAQPEGAVFSIDPVLLEILKPEVAGHLETVDAWLAACAAKGPQPVTDPLLRSIHTMNGAFAMTELGVMTDVTAPLEGFVKRALANNVVPNRAAVQVVADAAAAIRLTIAAIEKPRPVLPQFDELAARTIALRDALPDASTPSAPVHMEEDIAVMPQVVMLETADTSAIPHFEAPAPTPEPEPVAELPTEWQLAAEAEAPVEFGLSAEADAPVEQAPVVEAPMVEAPMVEAPMELSLMAEDAAPVVEAVAAPEPVAEVQAPSDWSLEEEAPAPVDEAPMELQPVAEEPELHVEPAVEEAAFTLDTIDLEAAPADFALEDTSAPELEESAALSESVDLDFGELAHASFEQEPAAMEVAPVDEAVEALELEAAHDAAPALEEMPAAGEIEATFAEEAAEEEEEEGVVEHAEFPEHEMLSLEVFLRDAAVPAVEAAPQAEAAPAFAFSIDEHEPEFEVEETSSELASEDNALDTPEAVAVLEMPPEPAMPELEPEPAVEAEPEVEAAFEAPAAADSTGVLAGMIAAYPEEEAAADAAVFSADELAGAEQLMDEAEVESVHAAEAEPAPLEVSLSDDFYGLSEAELEAMTAPEAAAEKAAPVEADGFADLPSISEVPAWATSEAESVMAETASPAPEPEPEPAFDHEAAAQAEAAARAEAERAEAERVEAERVEAERVEAERVAAERAEAERAEAERLEAERLEEERVAAERAESERLAAERAEAERVEAERLEAERAEAERAEAERAEAERAEAERAEEERAEEERAEAARVAAAAAAAAAATAAAAASPAAAPAPKAAVPTAGDAEDPDEALDTSDIDVELLDLFLEETTDILDHSDGLLAHLRENIDDRETIVGLQRDLHTLKGGARMAGMMSVGDLGHAMESLLEAVAEGRRALDSTGLVVLERGFDRLHSMVGRISQRKAVSMPSGLVAQVEALAEGKPLPSIGEAEAAAPAPAEAAAPAAAPAAPKPAVARPLSAPMDADADEELSSVRAPQEQVRIRADLLDRLVNYAGEVAIYRARLEQQLGAFRANLAELDQTTTRLREQLRRLDIETEAQIVARYQREGDSDEGNFDPLELDRFTNQQQLTRALNESANDLVNLQGVLDELTRQYETLLLQQSRVSSDLQEGLMRTRMVPFDALVPRLRRVLRQAAIDTGKQVQLKVDGASGEMDRNVLDRMTAPLEHMLRNSMAHGLETPEERRKARKPEEGTVRIAVLREGSEVVLKVTDDGKGLNKDAIRKKAIEKGIIAADAELSDDATYALILEGGFSTAETVTRLSGRGVGMDVVYSEIRQLGGTLHIKSDPGKGSEFTIRLPFTLAVTQAVFVKIGDTNFAVPIASVRGVGRISRPDLDKQLATGAPVFEYAGEDYGLFDLGSLIGHASAKAQESLQMPLLLARSGDLRSAILVDQVLGSREIVVKPVGPQVNSVPGIFGATIMGDGRVVVILDVAPLVRRHVAHLAHVALTPESERVAPAPAPVAQRIPVVMVVDDSITMRKVTGRVLERNNMEVLTAKDGVDAVEKMAERVPDLVLLDIEMPRMDGYEVAQNMKSDPRLKDVPIIMITSRTGDKHRQRAMDIGVDRYLGKPYQEPELMRNVFDVLGMEATSD